MSAAQHLRGVRRGTAILLAMIFLALFSALAVALATVSGANFQIAANQHRANAALHAAQSGLECARYLVKSVTLGQTNLNYVTVAQANQAWSKLCSHVQTTALDGKAAVTTQRFTDARGAGDELLTAALRSGIPGTEFAIRFYRYDSDPRTVKILSTGTDGAAIRRVGIDMAITKDRGILDYAIAGRGRMWLTGNTTIDGNLFSTWNRAGISPYNMTSDTTVYGIINTVRTLSQVQHDSYQLETLNADGLPIDAGGNPLETNYADRYHGLHDEIQGYHEGIKYGQPDNDMPGLDISDYDTDDYAASLTTLPSTSARQTEYFPHRSGNYTKPASSGSTSFSRYVYQDQTFSNLKVPPGRHALFRDCTFEDVLYIDCSKTSTSKSYTNNIRFENCTFNGVIVTRVPQNFNWVNNCLYFTGEATFENLVFANGRADYGGGVFVAHSSPVFRNCHFRDNVAVWKGGALFNSSASPTLIDCELTGNIAGNAQFPSDGSAGAVSVGNRTTTMIGCTVSQNSTSGSGGAFSVSTGGTLVLQSTRVCGNTAPTHAQIAASSGAIVTELDGACIANDCDDCPTAPPCPADLDGSGSVDGADLATMLASWGACRKGCVADLDGNGSVNGTDLAILLGAWGACR